MKIGVIIQNENCWNEEEKPYCFQRIEFACFFVPDPRNGGIGAIAKLAIPIFKDLLEVVEGFELVCVHF